MLYPKHQLRYSVLVALAQVMALIFLAEQTLLLSVVLIGLSVLLLWVYHFSKTAVLIYTIIGVGGFCAEALVVTGGAWEYGTQQLFALPFWLLTIWGTTGVSIGKLWSKIEKKYGQK